VWSTGENILIGEDMDKSLSQSQCGNYKFTLDCSGIEPEQWKPGN